MVCEETVNSGYNCHHSVTNILYFYLLSIRLKRLHRTVILHIVVYGFETWFFILRRRLKLRVFQSRIIRRIFGPKRVEETGDWRKLHY